MGWRRSIQKRALSEDVCTQNLRRGLNLIPQHGICLKNKANEKNEIDTLSSPVMKQSVAPHSQHALSTIHFENAALANIGLPVVFIAREKIATAIDPRINSN